MEPSAAASNDFVVSAFDREQWCPVLQARFRVGDLDGLRAILGKDADDDADLRHQYILNEAELAAIVTRFNIAFDPTKLQTETFDIFLFRPRRTADAPYLIHTGYELPLLLDGRKKLARMSHEYPPMTFDGEDRFDHWVAEGLLHREEVIEPFERPVKEWVGHRKVYYTPKGEEWRIPAEKLLGAASSKAGGWNEYFERLEGMLFGYENWQNDWWIETGLRGGGFGGQALCCAVSADGLAWIAASGFRALPPIEKPTLKLTAYDAKADADMRAILHEDPGSAALVRFNVGVRQVMRLIDLQSIGPWHLPTAQIPALNQCLVRSVVVVAQHDDKLLNQPTPGG